VEKKPILENDLKSSLEGYLKNIDLVKFRELFKYQTINEDFNYTDIGKEYLFKKEQTKIYSDKIIQGYTNKSLYPNKIDPYLEMYTKTQQSETLLEDPPETIEDFNKNNPERQIEKIPLQEGTVTTIELTRTVLIRDKKGRVVSEEVKRYKPPITSAREYWKSLSKRGYNVIN
jgi:hypothetical protein